MLLRSVLRSSSSPEVIVQNKYGIEVGFVYMNEKQQKASRNFSVETCSGIYFI